MTTNAPEELVSQLKRLTLDYEALDEQVDALLADYGGHSENMPQEAHDQFRDLVAKRADVYNHMKALERQLLDDT